MSSPSPRHPSTEELAAAVQPPMYPTYPASSSSMSFPSRFAPPPPPKSQPQQQMYYSSAVLQEFDRGERVFAQFWGKPPPNNGVSLLGAPMTTTIQQPVQPPLLQRSSHSASQPAPARDDRQHDLPSKVGQSSPEEGEIIDEPAEPFSSAPPESAIPQQFLSIGGVKLEAFQGGK